MTDTIRILNEPKMLVNELPPAHNGKCFSIRLSHPIQRLLPVMDAWTRECEAIVAYEHTHQNRVHCHIAIYNSKVCSKQLRNIAARAIGPDALRGNENCSMKKWDGDIQYIVYCARGQLDYLCDYGFNTQWLEYAKTLWVESAQAILPIQQLYNEWSASPHWLVKTPTQFDELGTPIYPIQTLTGEDVLKKARAFAASKHQGFMPVQANNMALSLYRSFCVRNGINYSK